MPACVPWFLVSSIFKASNSAWNPSFATNLSAFPFCFISWFPLLPSARRKALHAVLCKYIQSPYFKVNWFTNLYHICEVFFFPCNMIYPNQMWGHGAIFLPTIWWLLGISVSHGNNGLWTIFHLHRFSVLSPTSIWLISLNTHCLQLFLALSGTSTFLWETDFGE